MTLLIELNRASERTWEISGRFLSEAFVEIAQKLQSDSLQLYAYDAEGHSYASERQQIPTSVWENLEKLWSEENSSSFNEV